jgi:hemolysin III
MRHDWARWTLGKMQNPVRGFLHGGAAVLAVAATVFLIIRAPSATSRIAVAVFGLAMVGLYTASSLYHSVPWSTIWKKRMQRLDHSMIFVLIAGTYTPMAVIALDGVWRLTTLAVAWGIVVVGIGHHLWFPRDNQAVSIALSVTLGWLGIFIIVPVAQRAGLGPVLFAVAGGIVYTVGMVFMVTGRPRLWPKVFSSHELFHVFVIAGSALHFTMHWRYIVPLA